MISQARALKIKEHATKLVGAEWEEKLAQSMTPQENEEVMRHWMALPSTATYADAFENFLAGTTGESG